MNDGLDHKLRQINLSPEEYTSTEQNITDTKRVSVNSIGEALVTKVRTSDLKDGGTRKIYSTGAQKEDDSQTEGKGAFHLLPPTAIRRVAEIWRKGAIKYAPRNWEKGLPLSRLLDSGLRHAFQYLEGRQDEDHLAQAAWNFLALLHTEEMIKRGILPAELADLPSYKPVDADPSKWR